MITILLNLLVAMGAVPRFLVPLLPIILKNAPVFETAISGVIQAIQIIEKSDPSLVHNILIEVETIANDANTVISTITKTQYVVPTIPGYDANGNVIQIPNPDIHS